MSERRPPWRPPRKPRGFDDIPALSNEEVERRVDVRAGGVPRPPVERPVRDLRQRRRRQGGSVARDSLLALALVVVGIVTLRFFLFDAPATVSSTNPPSATQVAIGSPGTRTQTPGKSLGPEHTTGPVVDPSPELTPTPTPVAEPPTPEPSLPPGSTPRPTPRVTQKPSATPKVTPVPTPTPPGTATLIVKVTVTNDHGGSQAPGSWTFFPNSAGTSNPSSFAGSSVGTTVTISAGRYYQLTDQGPSGYTTTLSNDCSSERGGLPVGGTTETCTIVKNDRQPSVRVYTVVDGGPASPDDWSVTVTGTDANASPDQFAGNSSGVLVRLDANAGFAVAQSNAPGEGYVESTTGACASVSGLAPGAATTCTFTYTYVPPPSPAAAPLKVAALPSTGSLPVVALLLPIGPMLGLAATALRRWRGTRTN